MNSFTHALAMYQDLLDRSSLDWNAVAAVVERKDAELGRLFRVVAAAQEAVGQYLAVKLELEDSSNG